MITAAQVSTEAGPGDEHEAVLSRHAMAAEAHGEAALAHEAAAAKLCPELTEAAHEATRVALVAGGGTSEADPLPNWYVAAFRAASWSNVAFGVRGGSCPVAHLQGHQEAASAHRNARLYHRNFYESIVSKLLIF
ncbi:hypothetical protein [Methylobacterium brachythecii]|uniref:Uncharacterized protein n=1 Tax=Methylobacterium brachythecii TaxID=1176177 RepID=A0A7W6ANW9_9HYPH|nr:hypothetical protein [Methylobacterium brachythecii]MBB3904739.1 hypothetical protein [Methylobacterium brachythecii]GLS45586.1 hypothetical protein GCM10007884_35770 [Methylobacterium brachythecii]